jgi:hypothetical protein
MMMITFRFRKTSFRSGHALLVAGTLAAATFVVVACNEGGFTDDNVPEGDRCNPLASHNECSSGLVCTQASKPDGTGFGQGSGPIIPFCPENYCCSVDSMGNINSSNPSCQPGCNGGAAAICTAAAGSAACAFVTCTADASVASCVAASQEDGGSTEDAASGGEGGTDGGGGEAASEASAEASGSEGGAEGGTDSGGSPISDGAAESSADAGPDSPEASAPMDAATDVMGQ